MNLHEQLGALETGVDQLIQAVVAQQPENIPETPVQNAAPRPALAEHVAPEPAAQTLTPGRAAPAVVEDSAPVSDEPAPDPAGEPPAVQLQPTLEIDRPSQ